MVDDTSPAQFIRPELEQQTSTPGAQSEPIQGSAKVEDAMQPRMQASEPVLGAPQEQVQHQQSSILPADDHDDDVDIQKVAANDDASNTLADCHTQPKYHCSNRERTMCPCLGAAQLCHSRAPDGDQRCEVEYRECSGRADCPYCLQYYQEQKKAPCAHCGRPFSITNRQGRWRLKQHEDDCEKAQREKKAAARDVQARLVSDQLESEESKGPPRQRPRPHSDEFEQQTVPYQRARTDVNQQLINACLPQSMGASQMMPLFAAVAQSYQQQMMHQAQVMAIQMTANDQVAMIQGLLDIMNPARVDNSAVLDKVTEVRNLRQRLVEQVERDAGIYQQSFANLTQDIDTILDPVQALYAKQSKGTLRSIIEYIEGGVVGDDEADNYKKCYDELCEILSEVKMQPSKHQFAVAISAVRRFEDNHRQIWSQPAGTGKSRTLASMIYAFYKLAAKTRFNVYFANQEQIISDQGLFNELNMHLSQRGSFSIKFFNKDTFRQCKDADAVLNLVDEADYFLLDNELFKLGIKGQFVGMTATPLKEGNTTIEKKYLVDQLCVKICDSRIDPVIKTALTPAPTTFSNFFDDKRKCNWPKLVYCKHPFMIQSWASNFSGYYAVLSAVPDFRRLEPNCVYVIRDEVKMRGIDYQAKEGGIELFICAQFSNERAYEQAINRVGRNGQNCHRFILNEMSCPVDPKKEAALRKRLAAVKEINIVTN